MFFIIDMLKNHVIFEKEKDVFIMDNFYCKETSVDWNICFLFKKNRTEHMLRNKKERKHSTRRSFYLGQNVWRLVETTDKPKIFWPNLKIFKYNFPALVSPNFWTSNWLKMCWRHLKNINFVNCLLNKLFSFNS